MGYDARSLAETHEIYTGHPVNRRSGRRVGRPAICQFNLLNGHGR